MQLIESRLQQHQSQGLGRKLQVPHGIDFCSNDYLGFAQDPILQQRFNNRLPEILSGAAGSRLLRGNLPIYAETEKLLATFVDREAALLFASGYAANLGLLSALLRPGDFAFSDELNHASIIDGIKLSQAEKIIFPHRDYDFLEQQLKKYRDHNCLRVIVTESVFSMEGSKADLIKLTELATHYQALLIVDEAHSTGIWGKSLVSSLDLTQQVFATTHTAGKALGAAGAWVAGSTLLRDYLIHFARSFIFSTAPLPALALLLQEALTYYEMVGPQRAAAVRQRAQQLRDLLTLQTAADADDSPIISILLGENQRAVAISQWLQQKSWDVRAILPPTVKHGSARLRITVKWSNTEQQLQQFASDLDLLSTECCL